MLRVFYALSVPQQRRTAVRLYIPAENAYNIIVIFHAESSKGYKASNMPRTNDRYKKRKRKLTACHTLITAGVTLVFLVLFLLGVIYVMEKGPSPSATLLFCRSVKETSAIKWIANIFLPGETELLDTLDAAPELVDAQKSVNYDMIHIAPSSPSTGTPSQSGEPAQAEETVSSPENLEIIEIQKRTYKGKLMIVHDPTTVIVGTSDDLGHAPGLKLPELVEKYGGIAGTNAGGFNDESGKGDGGTPHGLVITNGEVAFGRAGKKYNNVIGLTKDGYLLIGNYTPEEALQAGFFYAVSFTMDGSLSGALLLNGEIQSHNLPSGINPRTAIGQRSDGALLLLVLDGRQVGTLGATLQDVCDVLLEYGAVNAANLDGGSSSMMVYQGEIINNCASVTGPRRIPDAFIVLPSGTENDPPEKEAN